MMLVGEEIGCIDEFLLEVFDFYDCEVDYDLKIFMVCIEFILLVFVVVMVLVLVLGIFFFMWGMMDVFKGW